MAGSFVSVSAREFRDGLPKGFKACQRDGSREIVFVRDILAGQHGNSGLVVIVFSGIELGAMESREVGEDAIHVGLLHEPSNKLLVSEDSVYRVGSVGAIMSRVRDRISDVERRIRREACPKCKAPLLRMNARNGRPFVGCTNYRITGCDFTKACAP